MKIKRFDNINENFSMETWTEEKFEKIDNMRKQLEKVDESACYLIAEYMTFNFIDELELEEDCIDEFTVLRYEKYENDINYSLYVNYQKEYGDDVEWISFTHKQFADLLEYMNNPDLYKSSKKYNL